MSLNVIFQVSSLISYQYINMSHKEYKNFVRSVRIPDSSREVQNKCLKDGEEAKKLYLEELTNSTDFQSSTKDTTFTQPTRKRKRKIVPEVVSNQKLFNNVENNDVDKIRHILDVFPDKISTIDEYGWSLLMMACQANSTDVVKELLNRGIDTTVRDKAGNSAQSLIIKNKNTILASILLNHKKELIISDNIQNNLIKKEKKFKDKYICTICDDKVFDNKQEHLSSTIHNINASRGKKLPTNYIIPESNKGYQIMLKVGWNKESGLGRDGSGPKYPIKAVLKNDKSGLGHEKSKKINCVGEKTEIKTFKKKVLERDEERNRRLEIKFRREFY